MKKILAFVAILFLLFSCGKYEDGPLISLRSVRKRSLGTFEVEKLLVNGIDKTGEFCADSAWIISVIFSDASGDPDPDAHTVNITTAYERYNFGYTYINFCGPVNESLTNTYGPIGVVNICWKLTRLKYREKRYKVTYNGDEYEIHFKRKQ